MLKIFWANRWYLLAASLAFVITLVVTTPLHWLWRYIEPELPPLPVRIEQVRGSLWDGRFVLDYPQLNVLGKIQGQWQLQFWPLLQGQAKLTLQFNTQDLRLTLPLLVTPEQLRLHQGTGYFDLQPLQPLLALQKGYAEGHVQVQGLNAEISLADFQPRNLAGQVFYSGGKIGLLVDSKPVQAELPSLFGELDQQEKRTVLAAHTPDNDELFSAYLQNDGWGGIEIRRRFIDALGQNWPVSSEPDSVIFEVSRKLLP